MLWHSRCMRGSDLSREYVTHCLDRFRACIYYVAPAVVNALRTVGHCGGSEVKNYINTVQFLAQTDRFMS